MAKAKAKTSTKKSAKKVSNPAAKKSTKSPIKPESKPTRHVPTPPKLTRLSEASTSGSRTPAQSKRKKACNSNRKVIIDTDPGADDAVAILMLLEHPDIDVLAITVTHGNASIQNTSRNAMRILNAAKRCDVPVYQGAAFSMTHEEVESDEFYGNDGMGDVKTEFDKPLRLIEGERAPQALVRLAKENKKEISLICIGPLTNVALAQRNDETFGSTLKECFIMGGNYTGRGNITLTAEFNFYLDPEAASVIMKDLECPITLIPWETCLSLSLTWDWYNKITGKNSKYSKFMKAIGGKMVENSRARRERYFVPADELAAACFIDNDLITESDKMFCQVELDGTLTRGQLVIDWRNDDCKKIDRKIKIVKSIDEEQFKEMIEGLVLLRNVSF